MQGSRIFVLLFALTACTTESGSKSRDGLAGVESGQTGGEIRSPENGGIGTGSGGGNCDEESSPLADASEKTQLGFSVNDILGFATGTKEAELRWSEPSAFGRGGAVPGVLTPESDTSQLSMTISEASTGARYVTSTPGSANAGGGGLLGGADQCVDRIEIDVQVAMTTAGGAFNEQFTATLVAEAPWSASMSIPFELEELMGSLEVSFPDLDDYEFEQLSIQTQLGPEGLFTGQIGGTITQNDGQVASAGRLDLASWGEMPCDPFEVPVSVNADLGGFSPLDILATINDAGPIPMTWADGTEAELQVEASTEAAHACIQSASSPPLLYFVSTLQATTSDGRMDSELEVDVFGHLDEGQQLAGVEFIFNGYMGKAVPAADFETAFGITGVDTSGQDSVTISFHSAYDATGTEPPTGALEVLGLTPAAPCNAAPAEGSGTPGCAGSSTVTLDSATW